MGLDISPPLMALPMLFVASQILNVLFNHNSEKLKIALFSGLLYISPLILYCLTILFSDIPPPFDRYPVKIGLLAVFQLCGSMAIGCLYSIETPVNRAPKALLELSLAISCLTFVTLLAQLTLEPPRLAVQESNYNGLLQLFGVSTTRAYLFFGSGFNYAAILPSAAIIILPLVYRQNRLVATLSLLNIIPIMLIDSRLSIVVIFIVPFIYFVFRNKAKALAFAMVALPITPLLITSVDVFGDAFFALSRGQMYGGFLSGREVIYESFFDRVPYFAYSNLIFGFGGYGQIAAGVSQGFDHLFVNFNPDARYLTGMHNAYLQMILDVGFFGAVLLCGAAIHVVRCACKSGEPLLKSFVVVLMLFCGAWGATETVLTPYVPEGLSLFAFLCGVVASSSHGKVQSKDQ